MKQISINFKMNFFVQFVILVTLCTIFVDGNTSLKRRVHSLERRVNSLEIRVNTDNDLANERFDYIEQNVEALNTSINDVQDDICASKTTVSEEKKQKYLDVHNQFAKNVEFATFRNVLSSGFAAEKKWVRETLQDFEKQTEKNISNFRSVLGRQDAAVTTKLDDMTVKQSETLEFHKTVMETKLIEMNMRIDNREQEIANNLSWIIKEILVITNDSIQSLKSEIKVNKEIINEQRHKIDSLQNNINNVTEMFRKASRNPTKAKTCPTGWKDYQSFCYLYVKDEKSYHSAREKCSSLGANVADIENSSENDFIKKYCEENGHVWRNGFFLSSKHPLWIGITDEDTEGVWISDRTNNEARYTNWRSGQPGGGTGQNCVLMGWSSPYDQWNDIECPQNYSFVCKMAASS